MLAALSLNVGVAVSGIAETACSVKGVTLSLVAHRMAGSSWICFVSAK